MPQAGEPALDLVADPGGDPARASPACAPAPTSTALADAARGRSRADWLVGMNLSRASDPRPRRDAPRSVASRRPTLAMLVERELAIRAFVPEDYLEVVATLRPARGPGAACRATGATAGTWFRGADGRPPRPGACRPDGGEAKADRRARAEGGRAEVESVECRDAARPAAAALRPHRAAAPRQPALRPEREADARGGAGALRAAASCSATRAPTAATCRRTWRPRCRRWCAAIAGRYTGARSPRAPASGRWAGASSTTRRSPTTTRSSRPRSPPTGSALCRDERQVYDLVCRRLLMAWHDDHVFVGHHGRSRGSSGPEADPGRGPLPLEPGTAVEQAGLEGARAAALASCRRAPGGRGRTGEDAGAATRARREAGSVEVLEARGGARRRRGRRGASPTPRCSRPWRRPGAALDDQELSEAMKQSGPRHPGHPRRDHRDAARAAATWSGRARPLAATDKGIRLIERRPSRREEPGADRRSGRPGSRGSSGAGRPRRASCGGSRPTCARWWPRPSGRAAGRGARRGGPGPASGRGAGRAARTAPAAVARPRRRRRLPRGATRDPPRRRRPPSSRRPPHPARLAPLASRLHELLRTAFRLDGLPAPPGGGVPGGGRGPGRAAGDADRRRQVALLPAPRARPRRHDARRLAPHRADGGPGREAPGARACAPSASTRAATGPRRAAGAAPPTSTGGSTSCSSRPSGWGSPASPRCWPGARRPSSRSTRPTASRSGATTSGPTTACSASACPRLRPAPVIALTATATPRVQDDIAAQLGLRHAERFIHGFRRTNIAIEVVEAWRRRCAATRWRRLLADPARRPAIVYAPTRKRGRSARRRRSAATVPAAAYHAGHDRRSAASACRPPSWPGELEVIVATIAFGMGIDKPDVRTVIHTGAARRRSRATTRRSAAPAATASPRGRCCSTPDATAAPTSSSTSGLPGAAGPRRACSRPWGRSRSHAEALARRLRLRRRRAGDGAREALDPRRCALLPGRRPAAACRGAKTSGSRRTGGSASTGGSSSTGYSASPTATPAGCRARAALRRPGGRRQGLRRLRRVRPRRLPGPVGAGTQTARTRGGEVRARVPAPP